MLHYAIKKCYLEIFEGGVWYGMIIPRSKMIWVEMVKSTIFRYIMIILYNNNFNHPYLSNHHPNQ